MQASTVKELSGWGNYPTCRSKVITPVTLEDFTFETTPLICRGQGRSYGDCALLSHGQVLSTTRCNRMIHFNESSGLLTAEAGTSLAEILNTFVPRGWFPKVMPGTQFVSLGGLVAADCHGKNHYREGSFGNDVAQLKLLTPSGYLTCSREQNTPHFYATLGGMGLTGLITEVTYQLKKVHTPYIEVKQLATSDLAHTLNLLKEQTENANYCAAWLDCLSDHTHLGRRHCHQRRSC